MKRSQNLLIAILTVFTWDQEILRTHAKYSCSDVRRAFVDRQVGPMRMVPYQPLKNQSLRICHTTGLTCCNSQMEGKFQSAAKRNLVDLIQKRTSSIKFNINSFTTKFEADVELLIKKAKSTTTDTLKSTLPGRYGNAYSDQIENAVEQLYSKIILRSSATDIQAAFKWFEDFMFNEMFGSSSRSSDITNQALYEECTANQRRKINPFKNIPTNAFKNISSALEMALNFRETLKVSKTVINATENVKVRKQCQVSLTRMEFCSDCYGLTLLKPCAKLCQNVIRGCLVGLSEIADFWVYYIESLLKLAQKMQSPNPKYNIEISFIEFNRQLKNVLVELGEEKNSIKKMVNRECKMFLGGKRRSKRSNKRRRIPSPDDLLDLTPNNKAVEALDADVPVLANPSKKHKNRRQTKKGDTLRRMSEIDRSRKHVRPPHELLRSVQFGKPPQKQKTEPSIVRKIQQSNSKSESTFHTRLERFLPILNATVDLYHNLPDDLCNSENENSLDVTKQDVCWDGNDIVDKYTKDVVDTGFESQVYNTEVQVNRIDTKLVETIEKLQLTTLELLHKLHEKKIPLLLKRTLRYKTISKKTFDNQTQPCDDEDDCGETGSGNGSDETSHAENDKAKFTTEQNKDTFKNKSKERLDINVSATLSIEKKTKSKNRNEKEEQYKKNEQNLNQHKKYQNSSNTIKGPGGGAYSANKNNHLILKSLISLLISLYYFNNQWRIF